MLITGGDMARMPKSDISDEATYLYTIECCSVEIDIFWGIESECPVCLSTFHTASYDNIAGELDIPPTTLCRQDNSDIEDIEDIEDI